MEENEENTRKIKKRRKIRWKDEEKKEKREKKTTEKKNNHKNNRHKNIAR